MTDTQPVHWLGITATRGPAGGEQWALTCTCGLVEVHVLLHLAEHAGREHVRANPPPQPAPSS